MTEEIKEILDKFSNRKQGTLLQAIRELKEQDVKHACVTTEENINKLLNYITNLQKENEELKQSKLLNIEFQDMEQRLVNYKSRNEKAIEYIKNAQERDESYEACSLYIPDLLNILEGGDE